MQFVSTMFATRTVYGYEMDEDDIATVINMYVEAGKRAEQAGFDLLEVSSGDDTLPTQFLQPRYNHRTDKYGGSFENRSRFLIDVLTALKRTLGARCAITTRFEMDNLHGPEGVEANEDGLRVLELLRREGVVDLVSLKIGDYAEWGEDAGAGRFRNSGWVTPFIKQGKEVLGPNIPVVGNGRFTSPDDMVNVLRSQVLDFIGAARPSIADPFLPKKIEEGRLEDIRECIGCNICVSKFNQVGQIMCTQNQTMGEEYRRGWHPERFAKTTAPCSVLIVGGGPAGMECARVLGERGYVVHLRDAESELGGHWKWVSRLPRNSRMGSCHHLSTDPARQAEERRSASRRRQNERPPTFSRMVPIESSWPPVRDGAGMELVREAARYPELTCHCPHCLTPEQIMAGKPVRRQAGTWYWMRRATSSAFPLLRCLRIRARRLSTYAMPRRWLNTAYSRWKRRTTSE